MNFVKLVDRFTFGIENEAAFLVKMIIYTTNVYNWKEMSRLNLIAFYTKAVLIDVYFALDVVWKSARN